ncbi:MAG: hypothetical protein JKY25_05890 [Robiginitomaculum sp.]|nr:hypothetical protein [Robiginitomaculum sp.]
MIQRTSEKLMIFANAGFILMILLDMVFDTGMFEGDHSFLRYGLLLVFVGNLGVVVRRVQNKNND